MLLFLKQKNHQFKGTNSTDINMALAESDKQIEHIFTIEQMNGSKFG